MWHLIEDNTLLWLLGVSEGYALSFTVQFLKKKSLHFKISGNIMHPFSCNMRSGRVPSHGGTVRLRIAGIKPHISKWLLHANTHSHTLPFIFLSPSTQKPHTWILSSEWHHLESSLLSSAIIYGFSSPVSLPDKLLHTPRGVLGANRQIRGATLADDCEWCVIGL